MMSFQRTAAYLSCTLLLTIFAPIYSSAQATGSDVAGRVQAVTNSSQSVLLSPGDSVRITIFDTPELSRDTRIGNDGKISLPLIGDIPVAGMSESQAAHVIDEAYINGKFVLRPQSSVLILGFALNGVSISGEVAKPGNYPVTGSRTLFDMIATAGGLTPMADTRITIQHSNGKLEDNVYLPVDSGQATLQNDVQVSPGDRVMVERAGMVYVLGDVSHPGGYLMQHNGRITVLQAIAQASGSSRTSNETTIFLVRRKGDSYTTEHLHLRDMYKGKTADVPLFAGDVVYVPASNVRNFAFNAPQILGTIAGAAIYSVGVTH